ncbi:MAG TPA: TetR/AcrR family transcriptional regulator C-terminal domain-containing protein [Novosphingobium sp.]|nr:TetR/AcrR family transcriptional regulator C-terminal domain-containing protein [Novosphingobium sp.]
MKIDREQITAVALDVLQAEGLDGLGMRPLAARLGVRASALYWHVEDKEQLYALMAGHFYRHAFRQAEAAGDAAGWLKALADGFRAILLQYRDSARLCAIAPPVAAASADEADRLAAPLVAMGMARASALSAIASVLALTLGWAVYEQSSAMHAHLAEMFDFDQAFAESLEAIVAGWATATGGR